MLPSDIETLIEEAEKAITNAVAPYSGFAVGAALVTVGGRVFRGCNVENYSLMLSLCAERAALIKALTEGEKEIKALAVVADDGRYCYPCGACRQILAEFAPDIEIFLASNVGVKKYTISELLPSLFRK
ncbi:MAG TPA: cytidine deaminase [Thermodesulfovibrionales bacterium]|nr:cytidine deaminase [Thermodesulfovibrionales bacterium]